MAKKKKAKAPSKACVGCGKSIAAATKTCPHCSTENPRKSRRKKARKATAQAAGRSAKAVDTLEVAIKFVEQTGSLKDAKAALEKIERIKGL